MSPKPTSVELQLGLLEVIREMSPSAGLEGPLEIQAPLSLMSALSATGSGQVSKEGMDLFHGHPCGQSQSPEHASTF